MNNELSEYMRETVKHILEIKKKIEFLGEEVMNHALHIRDLQKKTFKLEVEKIYKLEDRVKFLEEQDMKNAIRIHDLQKHTGTHPHEEKDE